MHKNHLIKEELRSKSMTKKTASRIHKIYPNVNIGQNFFVGEFVLIGAPAQGNKPGKVETIIGENAIIRSHTVIYAGNVIGDNFETGHGVNIRENNRIGNNVGIGTHSIVEHDVEIRDGVRIHSNVFIPEYSVLEEECWVGPSVTFVNALYPQGRRVKEYLKGPTVKQKAKIGANVTLLAGVTVGEMALIGAGSVITKDVPARKVVVGNPAKIIKDIKDLAGPFGPVYE